MADLLPVVDSRGVVVAVVVSRLCDLESWRPPVTTSPREEMYAACAALQQADHIASEREAGRIRAQAFQKRMADRRAHQ